MTGGQRGEDIVLLQYRENLFAKKLNYSSCPIVGTLVNPSP